ncbi:nitroreductase family protein [Candidatus Woesearchaeota archaeon]|nr:nitroreductase family protein [Candidatus Woesearchaeota archaeon]
MDALVCLNSRRSIRSFKQDNVEFEKIINIIDAGKSAPSAGNIQDWKFIIVVDSEKKEKLAEASSEQMWMSEAPVHIVVCSEPVKNERMYGERGKKVYSLQNSAAAAENMLLAAHAQGLGACWVGAFLESSVKKILDIPKKATPQSILVVGYPRGKPEIKPKLSIQDVLFFETWGNYNKKSVLKEEYEKFISSIKEKAEKLLKYIKKK